MNFSTAIREKMKIALIPVSLILLAGHHPQASSQPNRELEVTMHLDATAHNQSDLPKFRMERQNIGERDLILNLGFTLSNGSKQYPSALVLLIIDPEGKARQFDLMAEGVHEPQHLERALKPAVTFNSIADAWEAQCDCPCYTTVRRPSLQVVCETTCVPSLVK